MSALPERSDGDLNGIKKKTCRKLRDIGIKDKSKWGERGSGKVGRKDRREYRALQTILRTHLTYFEWNKKTLKISEEKNNKINCKYWTDHSGCKVENGP